MTIAVIYQMRAGEERLGFFKVSLPSSVRPASYFLCRSFGFLDRSVATGLSGYPFCIALPPFALRELPLPDLLPSTHTSRRLAGEPVCLPVSPHGAPSGL